MADLFAIFIIMSSLTLAGYIVRLLCRMVMSEQKKFKEKMMRDKFLAIQVDINNEFFTNECDHFLVGSGYHHPRICAECGCREQVDGMPDFSTWEGFGKLWEWAQEQEWFTVLCCDIGISGVVYDELIEPSMIDERFINPDQFANAVYEFLKEHNG